MSFKLIDGAESVGHLEGVTEDHVAAFVRLDDRGALVTVPRVDSGLDLFRVVAEDEDGEFGAANLRLQTADGLLHLTGCRSAGGSASSRGFGTTKIRARRVVSGGSGVGRYDEVDGMTSELDGLSSWVGMSTVSSTLEREDDEFKAIVMRAEHQDTVELGGSANAAVESSLAFNPMPKGNVFSITDVALLRTRSDELWPWAQHAAVHHMFQDLMCLVYGKPCLSKVSQVKREDDQPYLIRADDPKRLWRDAYEPTFGRTVVGVEPLDRAKALPLFRWSDCDPELLRSWIDEWDLWSRPTWIAVTTMFQKGTTVEARLLQIGVGLEALGHALWTDAGADSSANTSYPALLERVTDAIGFEHRALFGGGSAAAWRVEFNAAFKGSKHADNPLPEGSAALRLGDQAMAVIRTWLGCRLGVSQEVLVAGLERVRDRW